MVKGQFGSLISFRN